jgi:hypothetical protein
MLVPSDQYSAGEGRIHDGEEWGEDGDSERISALCQRQLPHGH